MLSNGQFFQLLSYYLEIPFLQQIYNNKEGRLPLIQENLRMIIKVACEPFHKQAQHTYLSEKFVFMKVASLLKILLYWRSHQYVILISYSLYKSNTEYISGTWNNISLPESC